MKRILPVIFISLLVNFFLFLMMTQMLTGKKVKPKEQADFQGIEIIDFKAQDLPPKKVKSAKAERPILPEVPPPLKITALSPIVRPKPVRPLPASPKLKQVEPKMEEVNAVIPPLPPIEKVKADPPPPVPIPPPDPILVEERPKPVPIPLPDPMLVEEPPKSVPIPAPIPIEERPAPEKVVEPDLPPLETIKVPVIEPEPPPEENPAPTIVPIQKAVATTENHKSEVVEMQSPQAETFEIASPEITPHPTEAMQTPTIEQSTPSSEEVQVAEDIPVTEEAQPIEDVTSVPVEAAVPPSKNIEPTLSDWEPATTETSSETVESENVRTEAIEIDARPLVRTRPRYPRRAVRAKLEGIVTIEFTIQTDGSVSDPTVVASAPPKIFDRAALRAIRKWKFRPKKVKGKAVARRAIQNIRFSLKSGKN